MPACLAALLGLGIFLNEFCSAQMQSGESFEPRFNGFVFNGIWIQLLIDPLCQADLFDSLNIPRARPISKTVQRVENGLIRSEIADWQTFKNRILFLLFVWSARRSGVDSVCGIRRKEERESKQPSQQACADRSKAPARSTENHVTNIS